MIAQTGKQLVPRAADNFYYFAEMCVRVDGHTYPTPTHLNYTLFHPVGVCALISPWNVPFYLNIAETVPALLVQERIVGGTPSAIEAATGRRAVATEEATTAAAASEEQAALLGVDAGAPVLLSRNVYVDAEGDTIEVGESVAPAGRWRVHRS